ncbi:MAG: histidine kinase [Propionibacteriaceae bacterium]|nr:histidine kinase [Propionibacteriaceae bacterium]
MDRPARWFTRIGRSGLPEAASALVMLTYNEVFQAGGDRTPTQAVVEIATFVFAGMTGRWPVVGTAGALTGLAVSTLLWPELGLHWFALFIPVVSHGAHGRARLRDFSAVTFCVLAIVKTIPLSVGTAEILQTILLWALLVGLAWATGRTVHRLRREGEQQARLREESLRNQRRSIARDLHDTVAYATTTMIMRAEQVKLRAADDPELVADLDFIISTGRRSVRDLRGMMETLRRNDPHLEPDPEHLWRLVTLEEVLQERRAELAAHGMRLEVSTGPGLDALPTSVRETLAKLVVEATSNMVKHAGPGPCRAIIELQGDLVEAVFTNPVKASGPGAAGLGAAGSGTPTGTGLGLVGAAERVEALGGELEVTTASGTWILRAQLPLER